jgi:hypothetical protein
VCRLLRNGRSREEEGVCVRLIAIWAGSRSVVGGRRSLCSFALAGELGKVGWLPSFG